MAKVRIFIAVLLTPNVRCRIAEIRDSLSASGADAKWVAEENFHITLKFLGDVESGRLREISTAVESAVEDAEPFDVVVAGAGAYPNMRRPSVVWAGIAGGGENLKTLADKIESSLESIGFTRDVRPFSPHITMGRVRSPRGLDALRGAIEQMPGDPIGSFRVDGVSVMRSDLRPSGPIYMENAHCAFPSKEYND